MSFLNSTVELLFIDGTRVDLLLDDKFAAACGLGGEAQALRVGDLRAYLFRNWTRLSNSGTRRGLEADNAIEPPTIEEQVQLLHLGSRLDPNEYLKALKLELSPIIHLLVKPMDQLCPSSKERKLDLKLGSNARSGQRSSKRRGSHSNTPVPAFVPHARPSITSTATEDGPEMVGTPRASDAANTGAQELPDLSKTHTSNNPAEDIAAKQHTLTQTDARHATRRNSLPPASVAETSKSARTGCSVLHLTTIHAFDVGIVAKRRGQYGDSVLSKVRIERCLSLAALLDQSLADVDLVVIEDIRGLFNLEFAKNYTGGAYFV
ncbi:hypothetical protein KL942_003615 [Ogataea angusta]|nr:hypothetical protein KL942_003615 [Ogataea angusta]